MNHRVAATHERVASLGGSGTSLHTASLAPDNLITTAPQSGPTAG
jgi:hypothetical protein